MWLELWEWLWPGYAFQVSTYPLRQKFEYVEWKGDFEVSEEVYLIHEIRKLSGDLKFKTKVVWYRFILI